MARRTFSSIDTHTLTMPLKAVAVLAVVSGFVLCSVPAHADTKNLSISSIDIAAPTKTTGVVTGRVSVVASDGDKVRYSVAKPANGTVSISSNGAFTYTPTATARHRAAKDGARPAAQRVVVRVVVTDSSGHRAAKSVRVPILGANSAPVASPVVIGTPDPKTGVVTGRVTFTDPDGDALTYSLTSNTSSVSRSGSITDPAGRPLSSTSSNGSLTMINPATGAFTYTPTQATPPSSGVSSTDTFTVSASDGYGGTTSVPVSVPVTAPNPASGVVVGTTGGKGGAG